MRPHVCALWMLALLLSLVGCGSGTQAPTLSTPTGRATFTVLWPDKTRLIPNASSSIVVQIANGSTMVSSQTLARPAAGGAATATFSLLPIGTLTATATAYPNADGTGVAQAHASLSLPIQANQNTPFNITMASTIDHIDVSATSVSVVAGQATSVVATAKDKAGDVVLTSALHWSVADTTLASIDQNGNVSGIKAGSTQITVTETESRQSKTIPLTVIPVGTPFLSDGFAYPVGAPILNQNGGTGNWGGAWNEYGQGYTSSVIAAGSLSFGRLATSGNALMTTSDHPIGHARKFSTAPVGPGQVLFISYLVQPLDALNAGSPFTYFELVFGGISIGKGGSSNFYGLENSGGGNRVDSTVPVVTGQTAFLVVRITYGAGAQTGNDTFDLFVNPTPGQPLPVVPDATRTNVNAGTPGDFNFGSSIRCLFDEVRFGHTFEDVSPTN